jgi:hypothetical protein
MKAEYAKIVDDVLESTPPGHTASAALKVAERCEALANKPVRELTDAEIEKISDRVEFAKFADDLAFARAIISAHIAKQSEPDEIPFDQAKLDEGGWEVRVYHSDKQSFIFREDANKVTLVRKT